MAEELQDVEEAVEEIEGEEAEEVAPQTIEDLASDLGWKPKDQYKGDPANWRDAAEFIRAGQDIGSHLRKEVRELREKTDRLVRTSAKETERMLAQQEAEINARWEQAIEDGDKTAAARAQREMAQLERQREEVNPEADFARANPWYNKDEDATAYAIGVSQRLAQQGKSIEDQLKAAAEGVRKNFPHLFEEQKEEPKPRRQAPALHAPSSRTSGAQKREKTAADLPRDVRQAGEEFVRMAQNKGRKYTIDDYARTYFAETGQVA